MFYYFGIINDIIKIYKMCLNNNLKDFYILFIIISNWDYVVLLMKKKLF